MKKITGVVLIVLYIMIGSLAAQDYSDIRSAMEKMITYMDKFATTVIAAKTADEVVVAINAFSDFLIAINPEMNALEKKYPEILKVADFPEGLQDLKAKFEAVQKKMTEMQPILMNFANDPKVMNAMSKVQATMAASQEGAEGDSQEKTQESTGENKQ